MTILFVSAGGHGTEGNGCARFVEIATQTVNLTNILTNLNSSTTNCNNTSGTNSEQMISPPILSPSILSPTKSHDDSHDATNQSHNAKSNNGHCIIDGNSNADVNDANANANADANADTNANEGIIIQKPAMPLHDPLEIAHIDAGSMMDTHDGDNTNADAIVKHDFETSATVTMPTQPSTSKASIESETTTTDDTDRTKKHTSADVVNGPANDLRV